MPFGPLLALVMASAPPIAPGEATPTARPDVLLIVTDDQGYGDLGLHGNPVVRTPRLDRLGRQSVRLSHFYVSPVCAPTRASLMTGRYNYRTRVVDTYLGRALMDPDEVTLAERLAAHGYRTGIFGKWHLGDNAPMRAIDQGFQHALVLRGGGIGQPSDPPGGSRYFDPILQRDGRTVKTSGYVTDVLTDAALDFLSRRDARPCFTYLAYNAPHDPLEVPEEDLQPYLAVGLPEVTARVYAMVANIDRNVGRLLDRLDATPQGRNTLVLFLTDNGPASERFNAGMRGRKGTVYEGGIRVPCFVRRPGAPASDAGRTLEPIAAHIDIVPTVLEACALPPGDTPRIDGVSLWPLLTGKADPASWPSRSLFFQWHRGDTPEKFRAFAAREPRFKLVRAEGPGAPLPARFELFDMPSDPTEHLDVSADHPAVVERLKRAYSDWFDDVSRTRGFAPPRIYLGSPLENPVALTRQDWRGPRAGGKPDDQGYWEVEAVRSGTYRVTLSLLAPRPSCVAHLTVGRTCLETPVAANALTVVFPTVPLDAGPARFAAWLDLGASTVGPWSVEVERME